MVGWRKGKGKGERGVVREDIHRFGAVGGER